MRMRLGRTVFVGLVLASAGILGQAQASQAAAPVAAPAAAAKTFDVASIRPSAPIDPMKMAADMQAGKMPNFGLHINGLRVEYNYTTLRELIPYAYKVKPVQVTGPGWLGETHFDIVARMPEGATRDDVPAMLQALLADRFKLVVHRDTAEHPVLALVVAKGGPKLKESPGEAAAIDPDSPLAPGEMQSDTPDGPVRMTLDLKHGGATMNMGKRGVITWAMNPQTMTVQVTASKTTMAALADMLTQLMTQMGGGSSGREVLDMTGLKGTYELELDFSLADMMAAARAQGMNVPGGPGAGGSPSSTMASDPGGGASVTDSLAKLGLKLESRKAPVEQVVVDSVNKQPTED